MGLKKYEIITVGNDRRVRALRSWKVGDRYVNIGDVGGIVYDEKTLSQDGACWLFRGNFNFPGARIGGDSVVDVGEEAPDVNSPKPDLNILGSSAVVGSKVRFSTTATVANAITLRAADFEQGSISYSAGANWETWKVPSAAHVRSKAPIFMGGIATTLKLDVPGYTVQVYVLDRDGVGLTATASTDTGAGVTLTVPAGQYMVIRLAKNPTAGIVPADATAAQIKYRGAYKNTLNIIDSRVSIDPVTDTANRLSVILGGTYPYTTDIEFPPSNIVGSTVSLTREAATSRSIYIVANVESSNASVRATGEDVVFVGVYSNVKNLVYTKVKASTNVAGKNSIQAYNCDNMVVNSTSFPGLAAMHTAGVPIKFYNCNLNNGRFYHHAQIANTYRGVNFDLAAADLGKAIASGQILVSAEVEGMYRLYSTTGSVFGGLVEGYDSVKSLNMTGGAASYGTTIYKDAYLSGLFDIAGTNVFGHKVRSHPLAQVINVAPRAVQGALSTSVVGQTITGVVPSTSVVSAPTPFRVAGSKGLTVLTPPAGLQVLVLLTDINNKVITNTGWVSVEINITPVSNAASFYAYISVRKTALTDLNPSDVAGTQIVTYNGCKIVNTGETAVNMKGNIRVEDNATLVNASITGSGYFGGNAVMSGMAVNGYAYMKDNTLCTKTSENVQTFASLVMEGNAVYNSIASLVLNGLKVYMYDNSKLLGDLRTSSPVLVMRDNATIAARSVLASGSAGIITIEGDAVLNYIVTTTGDITFCGSYNQTANIALIGKRVIDDQNTPEYDYNVKTQYDF